MHRVLDQRKRQARAALLRWHRARHVATRVPLTAAASAHQVGWNSHEQHIAYVLLRDVRSAGSDLANLQRIGCVHSRRKQ